MPVMPPADPDLSLPASAATARQRDNARLFCDDRVTPGPSKRAWLTMLLGLLLAAAVMPLDRWLYDAVRAVDLGGDPRRELHAWQQFGAVTSVAVVALVVALVDPPRRRRLLDLAAAYALVGVVVQALKMCIGRPRPRFDDPWFFTGPFGAYPVGPGRGVLHAWESGSALWSMPSSHTSAAVTLAVWIAVVYPRLRWPAIALAALVGAARVVFGAHWPSDVIAGAAVAGPLAYLAVSRYWGVRLLDAAWLRLVDRSATPAWPRVAAAALSSGGRAARGP